MASHVLYKRQISVQVGSLIVSGLRVQFKCEKTLRPQPNTLDLSITNLSPATRANMQAKGTPIIVTAGYTGNVEQLFSGNSRTIDHERKGADVVSRIQCGDFEQQFQYGNANFSFSAGVQVTDVVKAFANALGVGPGNLSSILAQGNFRGGLTQFARGYSYHGPASTGLTKLLRTLGLQWSVQDGQIQVLQPDQTTNEPLYLLTPDTGLIGSPTHGSPDRVGLKSTILKIKTLLLPGIKPGRKVQIRTTSIPGALYVVAKATYTGDSMGSGEDSWTMDAELSPLGQNPLLGVG